MLYGISNPDAAAAGKYFGDFANEQQLPVGIRHIEGADHNFSSAARRKQLYAQIRPFLDNLAQ